MSLYTKIENIAYKQIKKYGAKITVEYAGGGTFDPVAGTESGGSPTVKNGYGMITEYDDREIDGETIRRTDVKLIAAKIDPPAPNDDVTAGGKRYKVVNASTIRPGGVNVLVKVQLRG